MGSVFVSQCSRQNNEKFSKLHPVYTAGDQLADALPSRDECTGIQSEQLCRRRHAQLRDGEVFHQ